MDYSHIALLLAALALALLVAEIFIPSGGMILIAALICTAISIWCAWKAWWHTDPLVWWLYLGGLVALLPATVAAAFYVFPRTEFGKRLLVAPQDIEELTPYAKEEERLTQLIDKPGKTLTRLNPGGLVVIDGERLHSESEGMMIDAGQAVKVVAVKGNRVVVRSAPATPERPEEACDAESDAPDKPWLDFDASQS